MNETWWSLILDETTDVSVETKLVLVAQFWDMLSFKLNVSLIGMLHCPITTADGIVGTVCKTFDELGLHMGNIVGFAADTCNVMFGSSMQCQHYYEKNPQSHDH